MRSIRQTIPATATGAQDYILLDPYISPFSVNSYIEIPGGTTASLTVHTTIDDVQDTSVTPVWVADATYGTVTSSKGASYALPITAVRVTVGSISGGPVYFTVLQAGRVGYV